MTRRSEAREIRELAQRRLKDGLTRRRAWVMIAFVVVWNVAFGGLMVSMMFHDPAAIAFLPMLVLVVPFLGGAVWWLLKESTPSSELPSEFGGSDGPLLPTQPRRPAPVRLPSDMCRLCGSRMRPTEDLVRLEGELFHVVCAEPAMNHMPAWRERELGTLNQLTEGIGRSTLL